MADKNTSESFTPRSPQVKKKNNFVIVARRLMKNRSAVIGLSIVLVFVILAVLAPWVSPYEYDKIDLFNKFSKPSAEHWLGTDEMGRDILSRLLYGGRYSLSLGIFSVLLPMIVGSALGAIAGFFGGKVDLIIMRTMDIFQAIPDMLLCIAMSAVLGTGLFMTVIAMSFTRMPAFCRMLRAQFMSVGQQEYIEAANSMSISKPRIILKHILPNAWSPLIVQATMMVSTSLLVASSLSFIGLGVQAPTPEWGAMLAAARNYIRDYPHLIIAPGIPIIATVLGLNMFGDALRDALDPKLKN